MCVCTIVFSSWMVVLNQLVSHLLVLHCSFTGYPLDFNNDHLIGGRENGEIT